MDPRRFAPMFCLLILILVYPGSSHSSDRASLQSHGPIRISGDGGFTAANGVVSGLGSAEDPYIIQGWDVNSTASTGIVISGTTAYFIIRNVRVHGNQPFGIPLQDAKDAISLQNVQNGRIEHSQISSAGWGIRLDYSSNNGIVENLIEQVYSGIRISGGSANIVQANSIDHHLVTGIAVASSSNLVLYNRVSHGGFCWERLACFLGHGIVLASIQTSGTVVVSNTISDENSRGLLLVGVEHNTIFNNTLARNFDAIEISDSRDVSVTSNLISGGRNGIFVFVGSNHTFTDNQIVGNEGYGIGLFVTSGHVIRGNTIDGNPTAIWLQRAVDNTIVGNSLTNDEVGIFVCQPDVLGPFGNRFAPPANNFSGTQHPFWHCNRGQANVPPGTALSL